MSNICLRNNSQEDSLGAAANQIKYMKRKVKDYVYDEKRTGNQGSGIKKFEDHEGRA